MLYILDVIENQKTLFGRIKFFLKSYTEEIIIPVFEGKSFCRLKAKKRKGKIMWKQIEEKLESAGSLIVPADIKVPAEYEQLLFKGETLWDYMLFNSALDEIKRAEINPFTNRVAVVDYTGKYADSIEFLVPLAAEICVITAENKIYQSVAEKLMKKYGFSLVMKEDTNTLEEYAYMISPESQFVPLRFGGVAFCKHKKRLMNGKCLTGGGFRMPEHYEELWQKDINKLQFACALYELCSVKELRNIRFDEMCS